MTRPILLLALLLGLVSVARADEPAPVAPAQERFAKADSADIPDFQQHVVPLLGKLGCNGRACHGSFQGQGGFRLSLFGYDFKMDHEGLAERIDKEKPEDSYALKKALNIEEHKGGKRFESGSWEYNLFLAWIKSGAKPVDQPRTLKKLEITPSELLYSDKGQTTQLKAVVVWDDGSREDVTCLTRFQTNDPQVCDITQGGLVTSNEPGDTHIVAYYDNGVVPVPVIRPVSPNFGDKYPQVATKTKVDELVIEKLRKLGTLPSETCSDAEFLRRVSIDLTGTLPTADDVREFLKDSTPDKRSKKIDALMETPAYTAWWTTRLCDWTGNAASQLNNTGVGKDSSDREWYDWIYKRVAANVSYDKLCEGIVLATSKKPGESYEDLCKRMSESYKNDKSYADEDGLVYFWARQNFTKAEDRAIGFAYTFLGSRIQCAQCHKHPFDQWTQDDFKQFEAFFTRVNFARNGSDRKAYDKIVADLGLDPKKLNGNKLREEIAKAAKDGKLIPVPDLYVQAPKYNKNANAKKKDNGKKNTVPDSPKAKLLGGEVVDIDQLEDPRGPLMDWLKANPLFARAFVNRAWANYFNRGIVEPTDDMNLANPPCNEALLDHLAKGFIASGYDMKWVHREICNSDTYQRSWKPNETNRLDERNFSRAVPRRMPAESTVDAIHLATTRTSDVGNFDTDVKARASFQASTPRNNNGAGQLYALGVFGRSSRENACDCDRSSEVSLLQTLYMRNDQDVYKEIDRGDGWMAELGKEMGAKVIAAEEPPAKTRPGNYDAKLAELKEAAEKLKGSEDKKAYKIAVREAAQYERRYAKLPPAPKAETPVETAEVKPKNSSLPDDKLKSIIEEAYLRTVSRYPNDSETATALHFIQQAKTPLSGVRDLLWTLLNTKEFIVNH